MRVSCCKSKTPEALQPRMVDDDFHQPLGEALTAVTWQDEYIGEIGERRKIRDYPCKANLLVILKHSKAKGVFNALLDHIFRDFFGPV